MNFKNLNILISIYEYIQNIFTSMFRTSIGGRFRGSVHSKDDYIYHYPKTLHNRKVYYQTRGTRGMSFHSQSVRTLCDLADGWIGSYSMLYHDMDTLGEISTSIYSLYYVCYVCYMCYVSFQKLCNNCGVYLCFNLGMYLCINPNVYMCHRNLL